LPDLIWIAKADFQWSGVLKEMPLTWTKVMAAFDHVLNVVFGVPKDGPLYKALVKSGDTDIRDIISLDEADIDSLTYDKKLSLV